MSHEITGRTRLLALIGSPVGHSGSPQMYNYSFDKLGLDYVYVAFDVKEKEVPEAVRAMRLFGMRGGNVTMPDKTAAARCMDELSPAAKLIGAVNTIVNDEGHLTGHITDGEGFVLNLRAQGIGVSGGSIAVAGAGGAATAIQVQCALAGAKKMIILKRKNATFSRALENSEKIRATVPGCEVEVKDLSDPEAVREAMAESDIFVNATNVGMKPDDQNSVVKDVSFFRRELIVADAVYNPVRTRLLREASEAGCRTVDGRGMLLWQGAAAFRLFTGKEMPVEEVRDRFFS
ncbi:MAG: shikimate dehydrogenase [Bilifractor sp.]